MYAQFRISVYKLKLIFYFSLFFTLGLFNYLSRKRNYGKLMQPETLQIVDVTHFLLSVAFLYPLKTSENLQVFFIFSEGIEMQHCQEMVQIRQIFYTEKLSSVKSKVLWIEIKTYIFHISTIYLNHHQRCHNRFCHSKNNTAFF